MAKMIIDTNNICPVLGDKFNDLVNKGDVKNGTLQSTKGVTDKQYYSRTQELIANGPSHEKTYKIFPDSLWYSSL